MYNQTSYDDTSVVYADPYAYSDTPSLHIYWCSDCGLEFSADDAAQCPVCHSTNTHREH